MEVPLLCGVGDMRLPALLCYAGAGSASELPAGEGGSATGTG